MTALKTLLISGDQIQSLLSLDDCIEAVENAFSLYAQGKTLKPALMHVDAPAGEFHIKAGGLKLAKTYFGLKANGGFFGNRERYGMPNIQGMIVLCDGDNGFPLAIMDSVGITRIRTGAATAVAAKYLAWPDSSIATICGCGTQGEIQLRALKRVLPLEQVFAYGRDEAKTAAFAERMSNALDIEVTPTTVLGPAAKASDVIVTCTPSRAAFLMKEHVSPGTFIAAVGADSPDKQELDLLLTASAKVVPDILEQCEKVGELHHAIANRRMTRDQIYAEMGHIVAGLVPNHLDPDDIVMFDSTGTALQDVASAVVVYERAKAAGVGLDFSLSGA